MQGPDRTMSGIPDNPDDPTVLRAALAQAGLTIAAFRWRLRAAGFPFREPIDTERTIARIDALVYPEETARAKSKKSAPCQG